MSKALDRANLVAYSAGWSVVRHLPERAAYALFRTIADYSWWRRGRGVQRLEANLARAVGPGPVDETELRALSRAGMRSYFRYWCDAFRMPDWSHERIVGRVRVIGEERLHAEMARGKGVVIALPHMANWDHAGGWACLTVSPLATVAERLKPEELFEKFVAFRESLGMIVLPLTGGGARATARLAAHLRDGGLVCLPAERDLSSNGVQVTLFGEATRMPKGSAVLALRTGAALVPAILSYEGTEPNHRLVIDLRDPIAPPEPGPDQVARMTQALADVFSQGIAAHPADWHMMQRLFLADLEPDDPRRAQPASL